MSKNKGVEKTMEKETEKKAYDIKARKQELASQEVGIESSLTDSQKSAFFNKVVYGQLRKNLLILKAKKDTGELTPVDTLQKAKELLIDIADRIEDLG